MIELYGGGMYDLLPPNFKNDNENKALCYALDRLTEKVFERVRHTVIWPNVEGVPEDVADYLATELATPFYDSGLSLETKQKLVGGTLPWYSKLGTKDVIEEVIRLVFGSGEVREWFDYEGRPYFFMLETSAVIDSRDEMDKLVRLIYDLKNTRSWLDYIKRTRTSEAAIHMGTAIKHVRKRAVASKGMEFSPVSAHVYAGTAIKQVRRSAIRAAPNVIFASTNTHSVVAVKHVRRYKIMCREEGEDIGI